jgi:hypothetical protein
MLQVLEEEYNGEGVRLLGIRNPHGQNDWTGRFSDRDLETRDFVEELYARFDGEEFANTLEGDDGFFFMMFDDFAR